MAIANDLKEFFHNEGIHSTTIQPEFEEHTEKEDGCILECAPEKNCAAQTCCGAPPGDDKSKTKQSNGNAKLKDETTMTETNAENA